MYIKRFLLAVYSIFFIISMGWLFKEEIFKVLGIGNWEVNESELLEVYIPRIGIKKNVYNIDSSLNDVDYNVEILDSSSIEDNLYFLAAHSGSGDSGYFDDLVYLDKGDLVFLNFRDVSYVFVVDDMFYIQKNGYFNVSSDIWCDTLYLITCSLKYVDKQLIVRCRLVGVK